MVCYSDISKQKRLGVGQQTIYTHGVVSEEVAYEMAAGLIVSNPDYDVVMATTGYASSANISGVDLTGRCYLAIGDKKGIHVFAQQFTGSRQEITKKGVANAIFKLYKMLC